MGRSDSELGYWQRKTPAQNNLSSNQYSVIQSIEMVDNCEERTHLLKCGMPFSIVLNLDILRETNYLDIGIAINRHDGIQMSVSISSWEGNSKKFSVGRHKLKVSFPNIPFFSGNYTLSVWTKESTNHINDDGVQHALSFEIIDYNFNGHIFDFSAHTHAGCILKSTWELS